jgi:hypothetical protein
MSPSYLKTLKSPLDDVALYRYFAYDIFTMTLIYQRIITSQLTVALLLLLQFVCIKSFA